MHCKEKVDIGGESDSISPECITCRVPRFKSFLHQAVMLTTLQATLAKISHTQNVNILESHDYILNHHEKCINISTYMSSIGFVVEIDFGIF